ncbi:hypothetical protein I79_024857 [Cricetulus griseus]|uniref:Ig kappa chain V-I region n=1 Tax=Cricetulus griseus TaxID=10029 RepID=G3ILT5_CRIGR|nr:hypothetical protein I79_024857 [Cricetulus griseus]ERE66178.1 ig kappa chain V-I region [Cricetulus griseus]
MRTPTQILGLLLLCLIGARGDIQMTQSPALLSASVGESVTITCQSSQNIDNILAWCQQKTQNPPKLLICYAYSLVDGIPSRFSGSGSSLVDGIDSRFSSSGSGTQYSLKISGLQPEDIATYYCQQAVSTPPTVIQATT